MKLSDLQIPTVDVEVGPNAALTVRGLAGDDIALIVSRHTEEAVKLFEMVTSREDKGALDRDLVRQLMSKALQQFPGLVGSIIAAANDDPGAAEPARKLRLPVQAELLESIVGLTFESETELEKFVGTIARGLRTVTSAVKVLDGRRLPTG